MTRPELAARSRRGRDVMATMAEVIYDATLAMCDGIANEPQARKFSQDIAAAVAAHLRSPECLARVGEEITDELTNRKGLRHAWDNCDDEMQADIQDTLARAAIRVALGEHEGVGR